MQSSPSCHEAPFLCPPLYNRCAAPTASVTCRLAPFLAARTPRRSPERAVCASSLELPSLCATIVHRCRIHVAFPLSLLSNSDRRPPTRSSVTFRRVERASHAARLCVGDVGRRRATPPSSRLAGGRATTDSLPLPVPLATHRFVAFDQLSLAQASRPAL